MRSLQRHLRQRREPKTAKRNLQPKLSPKLSRSQRPLSQATCSTDTEDTRQQRPTEKTNARRLKVAVSTERGEKPVAASAPATQPATSAPVPAKAAPRASNDPRKKRASTKPKAPAKAKKPASETPNTVSNDVSSQENTPKG